MEINMKQIITKGLKYSTITIATNLNNVALKLIKPKACSKPLGIALLLAFLWCTSAKSYAQNPKLYVFLSFGQSNMEGNAPFEPQDTTVNNRFSVLQAVDCPE